MAAERLTFKMRGIELNYYTDLLMLAHRSTKFIQVHSTTRKQLEAYK